MISTFSAPFITVRGLPALESLLILELVGAGATHGGAASMGGIRPEYRGPGTSHFSDSTNHVTLKRRGADSRN